MHDIAVRKQTNRYNVLVGHLKRMDRLPQLGCLTHRGLSSHVRVAEELLRERLPLAA
jgi:hypothetical protein